MRDSSNLFLTASGSIVYQLKSMMVLEYLHSGLPINTFGRSLRTMRAAWFRISTLSKFQGAPLSSFVVKSKLRAASHAYCFPVLHIIGGE